jgi:DNA-binding CsgD family transcriptional regulator
MDMIKLLSEGKTVKEVAVITGENKRTIEKRIEVLKKKNKCLTITQLVVKLLSTDH